MHQGHKNKPIIYVGIGRIELLKIRNLTKWQNYRKHPMYGPIRKRLKLRMKLSLNPSDHVNSVYGNTSGMKSGLEW